MHGAEEVSRSGDRRNAERWPQLVEDESLGGMVNVAEGFDDTSSVINGATDLLKAVTGDGKTQCAALDRTALS
jgi:hypothetical protein